MKISDRTDKKIPKTIEALLKEILKEITSEDAICIAFCKELEVAKNSDEMNYFCDNHCRIHEEWSGRLLCLTMSTKKRLIE